MEIELSDLSGLPESLKPLVKTADGKSSLDLAKLMPIEDLTGLKTALVKERESNGAWSKFGKPDELAAKIADLEARAAKGGKGGEEAQAKLDAMDAQHKAQIESLSGQIAKERRLRAAGDLKAELSKAGVVPEGLDMLTTFAGSRITFNDDGSVKVLSPEGKPMIGSGADHGATLADLAKELAASMPYLVRDHGASGGGKPPGSNGGTPKPSISLADFNAMSAKERASAMASGITIKE